MIKRIAALVCLITFTLGSAFAQQPAEKKSTTKTRAKTPNVSAEIQQLKGMVEQQQREIDMLKEQLATRDQAVQTAQQQATAAQTAATQAASKADGAAADAASAQQAAAGLKSDIGDLKSNATATALALQEEQKRATELVESPLAIHYKGVTITPGGFLAAETAWRQHATASDVNTALTSIPFKGADAYHLSEFFGSGRQSRITLLAEGKLKTARLTGYFETDWLSAGVTSNNNQSNSYTNRQRQIWGQAALESGWTFTGGQMWSLVAETRKGLDNRSEALPMTIDAQYTVGFSWARQFGFRVAKNFNNKFWLGASVENAQTTNLGGGGFPNNFVIGSPGTGGGLYNSGETVNGPGALSPAANYSFNYTPDFVVKAAFEPGFGHYEIFGLVSNFRNRVYLNTPAGAPIAAVAPFTDVHTGGGGGANARWIFFQKHVEFGIHYLGGDGVGRYGTSQLAEVTAHPNGQLALIHSHQGLGTLEWHSKHWDIYTYGGAEYAQRTVYQNAAHAFVGYGRPDQAGTGNCLVEFTPTPPGGTGTTSTGTKTGFSPTANGCNDLRNIIEGTFGFWYKVYNGPKGRIQFGSQYSYIVLNTWRDKVAPTPHTNENMAFTSFRYYLP